MSETDYRGNLKKVTLWQPCQFLWWRHPKYVWFCV